MTVININRTPKKKKSKFFFLRETRSFAQSCDAPRTATVSSHRKSVGGGVGRGQSININRRERKNWFMLSVLRCLGLALCPIGTAHRSVYQTPPPGFGHVGVQFLQSVAEPTTFWPCKNAQKETNEIHSKKIEWMNAAKFQRAWWGGVARPMRKHILSDMRPSQCNCIYIYWMI